MLLNLELNISGDSLFLACKSQVLVCTGVLSCIDTICSSPTEVRCAFLNDGDDYFHFSSVQLSTD